MKPRESYYSVEELMDFGFAALGNDVRISRKCSLYGAENMRFGDHVRIDDFCILSGRIEIGSYVHVAAYCGLFGNAGIFLGDFSGLSSRVSIYSESEDYSGASLTNPTIPAEYRKITSRAVHIGRHALVGSGAVILPGVRLGEGVSVGALSLVTKTLDAWTIYSGIPARRLRARKQDVLALEAEFMADARFFPPATVQLN